MAAILSLSNNINNYQMWHDKPIYRHLSVPETVFSLQFSVFNVWLIYSVFSPACHDHAILNISASTESKAIMDTTPFRNRDLYPFRLVLIFRILFDYSVIRFLITIVLLNSSNGLIKILGGSY